jgi:RIO-like serine/threonine protein kinase
MIKRKVKTKVKKCKNPELESEVQEILSKFGKNIKFKYLAKGLEAETYYFTIDGSTKLKSGKYVLKLLKKPLSKKAFLKLKLLSSHNLIPEIFLLKNNHIVMKYIEGESLESLVKITYYDDIHIDSKLSNDEINIILLKVFKSLKIWHRLGFAHGDLHQGNIIISKLGKIYLIDPEINENSDNKDERNHDINLLRNLYKIINHEIPNNIIRIKAEKLFP